MCQGAWGAVQSMTSGLVRLLSSLGMRCLLRKGTAPSLQNVSQQLCCTSAVQVLGCDPHHIAPSLSISLFSIQSARHPQFFSYSSQITYIALNLPLQMPLNVFIMTVRSLIAVNNISYEQILFTDPTALPAM